MANQSCPRLGCILEGRRCHVFIEPKKVHKGEPNLPPDQTWASLPSDHGVRCTNKTSAPELVHPLFEIKPSSRHGLGMFARVTILPGTEILREEPYFPFEADLGKQIILEACFTFLSKDEQLRLMNLSSLCSCGKEPCVESPLKRIWNSSSCRLLLEYDKAPLVFHP